MLENISGDPDRSTRSPTMRKPHHSATAAPLLRLALGRVSTRGSRPRILVAKYWRLLTLCSRLLVSAPGRHPAESEQHSYSRRAVFLLEASAPLAPRRPARERCRRTAGAHILVADADIPVINSAGGIRDSPERGARSTPLRGRIHQRTRCRRRVLATGAPFHRPCEHPPRRECASDRP